MSASTFRLGLILVFAVVARAQTPGEARASASLQRAAKNPLELRAFLYAMPKGGELHYHLSNGPYAETLLLDAAADQLCINPARHSVVPNLGLTKSEPPRALCAEGLVPATDVETDHKLRDLMIDAWSMRTFVPVTGESGHDHFFSGPLRAAISQRHQGEWLDLVANRAAAQNESYLELMIVAPYRNTVSASGKMAWSGDLPALRAALLPAVRADLPGARASVDEMEATRSRLEHCGTAEAKPGCTVTTRFLQTILHERPPMEAFAQMVFAFELASTDPRVVGINMAQPEDWPMSMAEFHRQMTMLDYLHGVYPKVHIALHAGELAYGMVPPEDLFHIHEAVALGHAERIGHGVDVMYEADPYSLLQQMAEKHIMVEVNLSSNEEILGVTGKQHPLPVYLAHHVPIAFSTDDEGTSRIDLTHEYQRAVEEFGLDYLALKRSARTAIEHSFLAGSSLWEQADHFTRRNPACATIASDSCRAFVAASDKAKVQLDVERRFLVFEARQQESPSGPGYEERR